MFELLEALINDDSFISICWTLLIDIVLVILFIIGFHVLRRYCDTRSSKDKEHLAE